MSTEDTNSNIINPVPAPASAPDHPEIHTLPLWQTTVTGMRKEGIRYGQTYSVEFFELALCAKREGYDFGTGLAAIRRELEHDGFYLSARGQGGTGYVILDNAKNADVMLGYQATALDCLKRGVILGTNTRLDTLTENERRRHESVLARLAQKAALMQRKLPPELPSGQVAPDA